MTDQAFDVLRYVGKQWLIAGVGGYGFFTPAAHGIAVMDTMTCNYRGWIADFSMDAMDNVLRLSHATVFLDPAQHDLDNPPLLFDTAYSKEGALCGYSFDANEPLIAFTGGLLIDEWRDDYPASLHVTGVELPFHENVHELIFEDGFLIESYDRTEMVNNFDAATNTSKGRHKRVRQLDGAAQNRLIFRYKDIRFEQIE
ncbi:MAG: hypothetical protein H7Y38_11565 [Armatimonadetes bacterium]|nr:hypothetical protein [Armatimonadota bacterium]